MSTGRYIVLLALLLLVGLIALAGPDYVDWASCTRNNSGRYTDRVMSAVLAGNATSSIQLARLEKGRQRTIRLQIARRDHFASPKLDRPALRCTIPFPEVR